MVIAYAEKAAISGLAEASEQLAQMAVGMRKQFDLGRVVAAIAASGIQQKITGRVKTPGSPFDVNQSLQTNIINTAIDDAVNAAIADERISAESLALQALGIATGDVMQRTTMMQTLTSYEREMEKQSFERQANQANAETRANRTQLTASTQSKAARNRNSAIDDYLTASTQTLLGQPIPDIELTERNLPSFDDPRWTNVSGNKGATRLSRWQSTNASNDENKWVAFGKGFTEGMYDNVSGLMNNAPTSASMTQKITRIMLGENPIDVFINPTAIKNNLVAMYDDIHSTNPELKGYGWGNITFFGATAALPGGLVGDVERAGVLGKETFAKPNLLIQVLEDAKPISGKLNQLETILDDGTKVIFRRDVSEHAHPIGKTYKEPVDHYNIEVHTPSPGRPGKYTSIQNAHIIIDKDFKPVDVILKNKNFPNDNLINKSRY